MNGTESEVRMDSKQCSSWVSRSAHVPALKGSLFWFFPARLFYELVIMNKVDYSPHQTMENVQ